MALTNEPVTVICYGAKKEYSSRKEAYDFYMEGVLASDGCEKNRYATICSMLEFTNNPVVGDDEYYDKLSKLQNPTDIVYVPMFIDNKGEHLCYSDVETFYTNPSRKELEQIKQKLFTFYALSREREKRNSAVCILKIETNKIPNEMSLKWIASQLNGSYEYYLDYNEYQFITTKNNTINNFSYIAHKYGFKFTEHCTSKYDYSVSIEAKNTDNEFVTWLTYFPFKEELQIMGNTDELNLWLCDTRSDMTPDKIISFIDDLNVGLEKANIEVSVKELIDPEDWQEIANIPDASEDQRYYYPATMPEYDIEKE